MTFEILCTFGTDLAVDLFFLGGKRKKILRSVQISRENFGVQLKKMKRKVPFLTLNQFILYTSDQNINYFHINYKQ